MKQDTHKQHETAEKETDRTISGPTHQDTDCPVPSDPDSDPQDDQIIDPPDNSPGGDNTRRSDT